MALNNILARSTEISHPLGGTITTPLLIPSFSSKGFGFSKRGDESEISNYFKVATELLTESMLVSAYDLAYSYLPKINQPITEITYVDSGGYETSDIHDLSTINKIQVTKKTWKPEQLKRVYDDWSEAVPAVFVNYDNSKVRTSIEKQIESAENLLLSYPNQLRTILLKPETRDRDYIRVENIIANIKRLANFHIIGLTEKELGNSTLDKMKNIANIRLAMDDNNLKTPIHIFGSLDPITSPLYFLAGAEIFDGLTWLRFGYTKGVACYIHNSIALDVGIDQKNPGVLAQWITNNFKYLSNLQNEMKKYLLDKDFTMFKYNSEFLSDSYDSLRTRIPRLRG